MRRAPPPFPGNRQPRRWPNEEELRIKEAEAEALRREIADWNVGGEGERRTIAELSKLGPTWVILNDRAIRGREENIDHIVIGPGGVVVVDSKLWSQHAVFTCDGQTLFRDGKPEHLSVGWEADNVEQALNIGVSRCLAVWGAKIPAPPGETTTAVGNIGVIPGPQIAEALMALPAVLDGPAIQRLGKLAAARFPPKG